MPRTERRNRTTRPRTGQRGGRHVRRAHVVPVFVSRAIRGTWNWTTSVIINDVNHDWFSAEDRFPEEDLVPSPGGWTAPAGSRPGWNWLPPGGGSPRPDLVAWWIRILYQTPLLDRWAHELMWTRGGFLVLPPDHWWLNRYARRLSTSQTAGAACSCPDLVKGRARWSFAERLHRREPRSKNVGLPCTERSPRTPPITTAQPRQIGMGVAGPTSFPSPR